MFAEPFAHIFALATVLISIAGSAIVLRRLLATRAAAAADVAAVRSLLHAALRDAASYARRYDEVFATVEGVCRERDGWRKLADDCSREHGVAQQMMMQEIGRLQDKLRLNNIAFAPNQGVARVYQEFGAKYPQAETAQISDRDPGGS